MICIYTYIKFNSLILLIVFYSIFSDILCVCVLALSHEQASKTLSLFEGPSYNLHFYPWDGYIQHPISD